MAKVCFYFELHQPYRLENFSVFDIGTKQQYFTGKEELNRKIFQKVAQKSYLPMLTLLLELVRKHPEFCFAFSATGVFLEQAQAYAPKVVKLLQKLVATGQVEVLSETYHHSLASLYSVKEFKHQVLEHTKLMQKLFEVKPRIFRNTELIYSNAIGQMVEDLGYAGCITEAVDRYLHSRKRTQVFVGKTKKNLPLLLKHAQLSDDIAFRFSQTSWVSFPLTADTYLEWIDSYGHDELINLFMDFETFGEHQWEHTGIFEFFKVLVEKIVTQKSRETRSKKRKTTFVTPSMALAQLASQVALKLAPQASDSDDSGKSSRKNLPIYDVPEPISWADVDRDLTAWIDNPLQKDTLQALYALEEKVAKHKDAQLVKDWRVLQTSDHFYYMCTKWAADGDVHAYFSPYNSPFEAYRRFSIVLADLQERIRYYK